MLPTEVTFKVHRFLSKITFKLFIVIFVASHTCVFDARGFCVTLKSLLLRTLKAVPLQWVTVLAAQLILQRVGVRLGLLDLLQLKLIRAPLEFRTAVFHALFQHFQLN